MKLYEYNGYFFILSSILYKDNPEVVSKIGLKP
jgi:hypothetical protein